MISTIYGPAWDRVQAAAEFDADDTVAIAKMSSTPTKLYAADVPFPKFTTQKMRDRCRNLYKRFPPTEYTFFSFFAGYFFSSFNHKRGPTFFSMSKIHNRNRMMMGFLRVGTTDTARTSSSFIVLKFLVSSSDGWVVDIL